MFVCIWNMWRNREKEKIGNEKKIVFGFYLLYKLDVVCVQVDREREK